MYAAVVVTYSAPAEVLDRCLRSVVDAGGIDRIVVVDNGGRAVVSDDLADRVELIVLDNPGYGAAANRGFTAVADATAIALLNDDVVVQPGWFPPLADRLAAPHVGAAQPMLVGADHAVVTSLGVELDRFGAGSDIGDGAPVPADRSASDLDIFNGGAVVFDPRFLRATGGFDESFFLYYEDVDLALRGRRIGWRYVLVPESVVEHRRGTSTGADTEGTRFHQERNRLWTAFRFGAPTTIVRALWLSIRRLRRAPRSVHRRALLAGLSGAPRRLVRRVRAPGTRTARR
ncbi:MAG: glycosyltransferase family 2 protein [Ilumatobacteraceae bacterium]|nr:glycosyltransferase family 2 protein [Ilumatobacteraceae bacterium]